MLCFVTWYDMYFFDMKANYFTVCKEDNLEIIEFVGSFRGDMELVKVCYVISFVMYGIALLLLIDGLDRMIRKNSKHKYIYIDEFMLFAVCSLIKILLVLIPISNYFNMEIVSFAPYTEMVISIVCIILTIVAKIMLALNNGYIRVVPDKNMNDESARRLTPPELLYRVDDNKNNETDDFFIPPSL